MNYEKEAFTESKIDKQNELKEAAVLYPVHSSDQILQIHKYFTLRTVKRTFSKIRNLQSDIQKTVPSLPNGNSICSYFPFFRIIFTSAVFVFIEIVVTCGSAFSTGRPPFEHEKVRSKVDEK